MPGSGLNENVWQCTNTINAKYLSAHRRYQLQLNVVQNFELNHGITAQWTPEDTQYSAVIDYVKHWTFVCVVEELEGLVVQCLFKLSKANLVGTGTYHHYWYKMQKHISKAITRCLAVIRTALERYDKLAPSQCPLLKLDYSEVIRYSTLGEFLLLKHSRYRILEKPWTQPANHNMAIKYFKILHSQEEIQRLDEGTQALKDSGSHGLAAEMEVFYTERHRVNDVHHKLLLKTYTLEGYSGQRRSECDTGESENGSEEEDEGNEDEDDVVANAIQLGDYLNSVTA
ncbi:hypothetical protein PAXRUDRAFT_159398 [Paxillus rubicundulus Ve08.2h10]|uniref:Uncharacterized protein n=1 Tax=Paxillus rubicundulus Ve08.2h10 TaxID=930991 RepID=A0A0D0DNG1_9AGAM|nr:hypothetical protein PAXRUDRAFT_159398 [Paxillus rubicundulus Ve08.2h10]